jgi:hypothetical protein
MKLMMNYKYKNYEDAINKTCESIDKKLKHILKYDDE